MFALLFINVLTVVDGWYADNSAMSWLSPIRLSACNGENLIPLVIIVCMCEVFSPERRCTRHALQKHYTNRQIFKKF